MSDSLRHLKSNRKTSKRRRWAFGPRRYWPSTIHQKAVEIAHIRLAILKARHSELLKIVKPKAKTEVTLEFLQLLNSGLFIPEGTAFKLKHLGRATLYNWEKAYRESGFRALLPRYKWKPGSGATLVPINLTWNPKEIKIPGPPKRHAKDDILFWIRQQWQDPPLECPIRLAIFYSMPIRKRTKMPRRMKMLNGKISHTGKPYLDFLNSHIMDCLAGIVFYDHSQVVTFHSEKVYRWEPQTLILIRPLSG
jgi:Holliday junction resolvase RusA-like endonuclease